MKTITYKITKAHGLFNLRVNDTFIIRNGQCFKKFYNERMFTRCAAYDNFDFNVFVTAGIAEMTTKEEPDTKYKTGDLVVYNIDGPQNISMEHPIHKNQICRVDAAVFRGKTIYYQLTNVCTGEKLNQHVKETKLPHRSGMYWFIDSHGTVKQTYFFLRTCDDIYRYVTKNMFYNYDDAQKQLNKKTADVDRVDIIKTIDNYLNAAYENK